MGHQMGHAAFSSIRFTQFRVYMMLPEHAVYIIVLASIVEKNVFIGDISPYLDTDWHYLPKT
jgi:hypothetical protein